MKTSITHVAMDVHKKQHEVALVYPDTGEMQTFAVRNTQEELAKMVKRIRRQAPGEIHVCYEALVRELAGFLWAMLRQLRQPPQVQDT